MGMQTGGLPGAYRRIEYLECSGTQYIATNYIPSVDDIDVSMEYAFTLRQSDDRMLWGIIGGSKLKTWQCEYYDNKKWYVGVGVKQFRAVLDNVGASLNTKYKLTVSGGILTVDEMSANWNSNRNGENSGNMYIFAWNANGSAQYKNNGSRIYSLEFKENGNAAANFVPCIRKSDSKPGMYDTVSKTFYTNAGTGEFIVPA